MATAFLPESALSLGSRIGRYFSLVSMLPSLLLVVWVYALLASRAWSGRPDLAAVAGQLGSWSLGEVAWLLAIALALSLFLHPLQFTMTQVLEGYWGHSRLLIKLATIRILHHRKRVFRLNNQAKRNNRILKKATRDHYSRHKTTWTDAELQDFENELMNGSASDCLVSFLAAKEAAKKEAGRYPEARRVLPTRLGNALRQFEDSAGSQYGIDELLTSPHFTLITPKAHAKYLEDCGMVMDVTIRLCMVSLLATVAGIVFLATDGLWLLTALVPYVFAYIAYRAAIVAAEDYGVARRTIIDLDRFLLYENLGLERPHDTKEERSNNKRLMELLRNADETAPPPVVRYAPKDVDGSPSPYR